MTSDILNRRLHGVAIYNPDLLSKHELVAQFAARQELLDHMVADLHRPGFNQHQVIVGNRGMGKTTLLRRLRYAIEDDPALSKAWLPLTFPEEQYNVGRLSDLYLNFIDALSDALEQSGRREEAGALDDAVETLPRDDEQKRASAALDLLLGTAERLGRRLVLLVDNLDLVLQRLEKQESAQWALRELLSQEPRLLLVGAMPVIIGATYDYEAPFYDFFRIHELRGLTREETKVVLTRLSRELGAPDVERLLERDPGRIDTLHTLTGGNPRTIVLLFGVLAQGTEGDVRSDLEKLLDQCTPLYKARFETLPIQAQQVVDAVAIHWDPISAGELVDKLPMEINAISAQLNRLVQQGMLEKVDYHPTTKIGFQVAERFFNIWYLMRASRRVRRRLIWLVQFLRLFYGADQVKTQARDLLDAASRESSDEKLRHAEYCLAIAQLIEDDRSMRFALESRAIRTLLSDQFLTEQITAMLDLDGEDASLREVVDRERWVKEFARTLDRAGLRADEKQRAGELVGGAPISRQERLALAKRLSSSNKKERDQIYGSLEVGRQQMMHLYGPSYATKIVLALSRGFLNNIDDGVGAATAAAVLGIPELEAIGSQDWHDSVDMLRRLARQTNSPFIKVLLAGELMELGELGEARRQVAEAQEQEKSSYADFVSGMIAERAGHLEDAAAFFERYAMVAPAPAMVLRRLGKLQEKLGRTEAAFAAFERALGEDRDASTLADYGAALARAARHSDAERVLREGLEKEPGHVFATAMLVFLLVKLGRSTEALNLVRPIDESSHPRMRFALAVASMAVGNREEALRLVRPLSTTETDLTVVAVQSQMLFVLDAPNDALAALHRVLSSGPEYVVSITAVLIGVFGIAIAHGQGASVLGLLEELELQEPLRPAYEALRIILTEDRQALKRLSPEVQQATAELLDRWMTLQAKHRPKPKTEARKKTATPRRRR